jgi:Mce-associated membrane protein
MADDAAAPEGEPTESAARAQGTATTDVEPFDGQPDSASEETSDAADHTTEADEGADRRAPGKRSIPTGRLALIVGLIAVVALGGVCGWLGHRAYQSHQAGKQRQLFVQVARQAALNLTTIDYQHADADVQRILDSATGQFYDDFSKRSQPFVDVVKQAQSKSVGTVTEAGLEAEDHDGAEVIVAVAVNTSNAGAPQQQPRAWRMRLTVQSVGGDAKVSNVGFVP